MKKPAVIMLLIVVLLAGAVYIFLNQPKKTGNLKVSGSIETTTVELSFKVAGRLHRRLVEEGDAVKSGQQVAVLVATEFREERDARAAELRAAQAGLQDLLAGSRREEITQAEAALSRVRAEADRAARDYLRADELYRRDIIARQELDAASAGRDSTASAVREAEERLKLLKAGPRPDAVDQARSRIAAAQAARDLADTRLAETTIVSPVDGLVLAKHAEPGEMLAAGAPVVTVGKLAEVWLKAYIPETELGRVKIGQSVRVTTDTWPGKAYNGTITFISSQAEFTPKNVQTEKERVRLVYRVKITLPNPALELKPGMPADAVIETGAQRL